MCNYCGIKEIKYVGNGCYSDPQLEYKGHTYNIHDVEDTLYDEYLSEKEADGEYNEEEYDDEAFRKWVKENKETVFGILEDILPDDLYEEDGVYYEIVGAQRGPAMSIFKFREWGNEENVKYKLHEEAYNKFQKGWCDDLEDAKEAMIMMNDWEE